MSGMDVLEQAEHQRRLANVRAFLIERGFASPEMTDHEIVSDAASRFVGVFHEKFESALRYLTAAANEGSVALSEALDRLEDEGISLS